LIVLWAEAPARRVGFAVSRQVRGAVQRNRVRRRLREAYRAARDAAPVRVAMIVIGRPRAAVTEFVGLVSELRAALRAIPGERAPA
jgi:ribonuclease P protein component